MQGPLIAARFDCGRQGLRGAIRCGQLAWEMMMNPATHITYLRYRYADFIGLGELHDLPPLPMGDWFGASA